MNLQARARTRVRFSLQSPSAIDARALMRCSASLLNSELTSPSQAEHPSGDEGQRETVCDERIHANKDLKFTN
jgi:hypothetical protein